MAERKLTRALGKYWVIINDLPCIHVHIARIHTYIACIHANNNYVRTYTCNVCAYM